MFVCSLGLFAALLLGVQCDNSGQRERLLRVGAILPLTGNLAVLGVPERQGLELGVDHANKLLEQDKATFRLELLVEDTQGDPKNAVSAAQRLLLSGATTFVVSTTGASRAVAPITTSARRLTISLCMDPTIQRESPLLFRLYEGMDQEAQEIVNYFATVPNRTELRLALLYVNHAGAVQQLQDYFRPGFRHLGINFVADEPYQIGQSNFRDLAAKLKAANPTHLIVIGYGFENQAIMRDLKLSGFAGKVVGGWGFVAIQNLPSSESEGILVAAPRYLLATPPATSSFERDFINRYKSPPNFDAAFAYTSIQMIAAAAQHVGNPTSSDEVATALSRMGPIDSILGKVYLTDDRGLIVPMGMGAWKHGHIVPLESIDKN
jgi:branched-chain amino acid transport system substrate-binding protein